MATFALALGAGGARGLAHIHVAAAFEELGISPSIVSGSSIGSIIGAAMCSGMSSDELLTYVDEVLADPLGVMWDVFRMRPDSLGTFFREGGPRIGELNLERVLEGVLPEDFPRDFADLKIPLKVSATNFYGECAEVFDRGDLRFAMAASSAIPAVFLPVERDGQFFIDGNATDPCPIDIVQGHADHVLAVDVSGGPSGDPTKRPSKLDVTYASGQMMQKSIVRTAASKFPKTVLLRPPVNEYMALDFLKGREILAQTASLKEETKRAADRLLAGVTD